MYLYRTLLYIYIYINKSRLNQLLLGFVIALLKCPFSSGFFDKDLLNVKRQGRLEYFY